MLSSLWKTLEEEGYDVDTIKEEIKDTVTKAILTLEPYIYNYYRIGITKDDEKISESKVFHVLGLDILIDKKCKAWLMEINANPSLNVYNDKELPNGDIEQTLSEIDKFVKTNLVTDTIALL